ncbi:TetR/AcrR family transcriptional regulator [Xanthomonas sp. AM6]|uniref:TetR/AcrR family transcriptional regulator n=1 Tax=Xanthomonas sp. AM6 TaxID=2982531 RepID=UPI0021D89AE8|nr:TetR/AcrR family transcriptional regulator [Xanthomonas sp. AM6]UYB53418.1 TetR/AcrR family transcriptional regulator [Xanthomonas sp. AM6]
MSNLVDLRSAREREQRIRDAALDAAEQCITDKGLGATTFELIAETGGVSCSALRRRFGDKRGLVRALMERSYEQSLRAMWMIERPPHLDATDFIAGALEEWLLSEADGRRLRLGLEIDLAAARDPELAEYSRRRGISLIEHLGDMLKRLLRGHGGWNGSEQEFQARVYAVAAMCVGLHMMMVGVELKRMHLQLILSESLAGMLRSAPASA